MQTPPSTMVIRAYATPEKEGAKPVEIVGATCDIASDELRARAVTPQEVILPTFKQRGKFENRGLPGSLAVSCKAGPKSGKAVVTANEKSVATTTGGGIAGALITIAVTAAVANSTPWQYPAQVGVTLSE